LSENPLLPRRKLRELHALMLRCRAVERRQKSDAVREALLAATLMQLLPGDLLSAAEGDAAAGQLAPAAKKPGLGSVVGGAAIDARLPQSAAAARGLQAAGSDGLVLALARAGSAEPEWVGALEWAQEAQLPLIVACADATNGARSRSVKQREPALDFESMSRLAKRLKLPILTVDGEDAVAVYRVMQESVLRTRMGGGPAVLWAVMTPPRSIATMPASRQPIARLRSYMAARKISLKA
jgi:pyruvate dehydrogenase E1 component alpha subunit